MAYQLRRRIDEGNAAYRIEMIRGHISDPPCFIRDTLSDLLQELLFHLSGGKLLGNNNQIFDRQ
jgi:hypothetical protein